MKCADCQFWEEFKSDMGPPKPNYRRGECRRFPPTGAFDGGFPTTHAEVWCGEFKREHLEADPLLRLSDEARL